jgi:acetyltransferase-like isoleucine patch superfamily enzyme
MGDSYINAHSRILCGDQITIGDGVGIAWNCEILDDDRHQLITDDTTHDQTGPITIEDDVWIGHDVSINKGVTVGEGSVIANDSVVIDDVPAHTLVAGSPATVKKKNVRWK